MYGKIFDQIFNSSIAERPLTRLVFMDLIILCDKNGVIDMTHEAIARRTNVPIETVRTAIEELEQPDPKSRSNREGGARIKRLDAHRDWGWFLVNHDTYRGINTDERYRAKTRERVAKFRAKADLKKEAPPNPPEEKEDIRIRSVTQPCNARNATVTLHDYSINPPTEPEFLQTVSMVALPDAEKIKCFHHYNAQGWMRGKSGLPVQNLISIATSWKTEYESRASISGNQKPLQQTFVKKPYVPNI